MDVSFFCFFFFTFSLWVQKIFLSLQPTLDSPKRVGGQVLLENRTFTNAVFDCRISQIHWSRRDATVTSTLGVLSHVHLKCMMNMFYNIPWRGLSRVAYPGQGNARARQWDKRRVENSHVFCVLRAQPETY